MRPAACSSVSFKNSHDAKFYFLFEMTRGLFGELFEDTAFNVRNDALMQELEHAFSFYHRIDHNFQLVT